MKARSPSHAGRSTAHDTQFTRNTIEVLDLVLKEANRANAPIGAKVEPVVCATRHAVTHYRVLARGKRRTLVELTLETGRRHQIRVHLADAGCPIVGDKKYGAKTDVVKRLALHACALRLVHPVTHKELRFTSPLPRELAQLV